MMILSFFNKFKKKYFFADKNVHTASNLRLFLSNLFKLDPDLQ